MISLPTSRNTAKNAIFALVLAASGMAGVPAQAAAPDLNGGVWQAIDPPQQLLTEDGKLPPLLPAAMAVYQHHMDQRKAGDLSFDTTRKCLPPGLPRLLTMPGYVFEFVQRPERIMVFYQWNRLARSIDMKWPQGDLLVPSFEGQSVGRWEGNTLVIDSIGFKDGTLLDAAGLPHDDALHLIERYTPSRDGSTMALELTIEDPTEYAAPWKVGFNFRRDPAGRVPEDICLEREHIDWGHWNAIR